MPDEGRYVGVALEMMRSGDWLTPTLDGLPFFHKPPLFYWITAGSMSLFGLNEWAARVAPILGATTGAIAMYLFVRRWAGDRAARLTLVALLVQPLFYIGAQFANLDMLVAGCISATIVLLAHASLSIEHQLAYRPALAGAYLMAALGVLSKGLIGAVLPALVMLCWLATTQRWRVLRGLVWAPGMVIFLLVAAPWFVAMQAHYASFLDYFFIVQQFQRFAGSGFNNVQPFWYYPAILLVACAAWLPWLYRSLLRHDLTAAGPGEFRLLMWMWVAIVVLFFSLPRSKLLGYVLPALPPLAFLIADGFMTVLTPSSKAQRLWWGGAAVGTALSLGTVVVFSVHPLHSSQALAAVLGAQRAANEPIFMLNHFYYDLPFYTRVNGPIGVVDDWASADVYRLDNWRKELAEAGRFAPERSATTLIEPGALAASACAAPVSWIVGDRASPAQYPVLALANAVVSAGAVTLWRLDTRTPTSARSGRCPGRAADSPARPEARSTAAVRSFAESGVRAR